MLSTEPELEEEEEKDPYLKEPLTVNPQVSVFLKWNSTDLSELSLKKELVKL